MEKHLFVGAHPDDIEFGCGGTIAKAITEGIDCHTLVFSDCHETLQETNLSAKSIVNESIEALRSLGISVENMNWYNFPVRKFEMYKTEILDILVQDFRELNWTKIYIPNRFDVHQDHSVITEECMRALKFASIYGYELPWNNFESNINVYNILNDDQVLSKIEAIRKFKSQKTRFYSLDTKIRAVVSFRGLQVNAEFAEGFESIRLIHD
jgi:hypothetical protein